MAREFKDRVQDTTQTTGTGSFTLDAATIAGFRTFGSAHTVGSTLDYYVGSGNDWEAGTGTLTSANVLARTTVNASSNGNALVNFSAGSKTIFETVGASTFALLQQGTTSVTVPASGDTTGATDAATINNMLFISNRVTLQSNQKYYVNTPIVINSHQHLVAYGATITLVAGVKGNIIINKAVLPTRTTNDGIYFFVSGNATLSSLTANFTSADVGATVGLKGAGASNGTGAATWYAKITSTFNPTTATAWTASKAWNSSTFNRPSTANGFIYQVTSGNGTTGTTEPTWPTTNGATVTDGTITWTCRGASTCAVLATTGLTSVLTYTAASSFGQLDIFAPIDRNTDITIAGGTWVITDALFGGHLTGSNYRNSFASAFRRVDRLRIIDTTWDATPDANTGGRFTISVADATSVDVLNTNFIRTGGDGVHLTGPISYALVQNVRGNTNDDMTVANPQDFYTPYITDTEGSMNNMTFRDVAVTYSNSAAFRLYEGGVTGRFRVDKLLIENISTSSLNMAVCIGDANIDLVKIRNISGSPTAGTAPLIQFNTALMSGCEVDGVTWNYNYMNSVGVIQLLAASGSLVFKNIRYNMPEGSPDYAAKTIAVCFQGSLSRVTDIVIDGLYTTTIAKSGAQFYPNNLTALQLAVTDSLGSTNINLRNIQGRGTNGQMIYKLLPVRTPRISISDSNWNGPALLNLQASEAITTVLALNNVGGTIANLVTALSPIKLEMVNSDVSTSSAMVALTGTGASADIQITHATQLGAGALVSRDGSQTIRVRGASIPVDQTLLTPSDGDTIYNSNATPTNGIGVAMYNTAAAKWKNLYSGTTN